MVCNVNYTSVYLANCYFITYVVLGCTSYKNSSTKTTA